MKRVTLVLLALFAVSSIAFAKGNKDAGAGAAQPFKVLVLSEGGGQHGPFTDAGMKWLTEQSGTLGFEYTVINNTSLISDAYLSQYRLIIQLDYPPYMETPEGEAAFTKYIDEGLGGYIGFHHATLLGSNFLGLPPMWQWFSDFMGGIEYENYIAALASGTVNVENSSHPVMKGVPASFVIPDDEWYTYNKNPRPNVQVLASVDENTYQPDTDIKMGDHPAIWSNPAKKARNVYFIFGHSPKLFQTEAFTTLFRNAIEWASGK